MEVEVKNCNNIDYAKINIETNTLNIKYALNGTGKSSIANAIVYSVNEPEKLKNLKPFKYKDDESIVSEIHCSESINKIRVFNEKYINLFVYKKTELLNNSFEIFIKDENYILHQEKIEEIVKSVKELFQTNETILNLEKTLKNFIDDYKVTNTGWAANGVFGKGLAKGNKLYNIPKEIKVYEPYLISENPVNWLKWQIEGNDYLPISDICPFCSSENIESKRNAIEKIKEEYEPKYVEHLSKMVSLLDKLSEFISEDSKMKLEAIKNNIAGLSNEQKDFIKRINSEIVTLYNKVIEMKNISFKELENIDDIQKHISELLIQIDYLDDLKSEKMIMIVKDINDSIQKLLDKIGILKGQIIQQKNLINKKIEDNKEDINGFLEYAGYKYRVDIIPDKEEYKLVLYHKDYSKQEITESSEVLSYGEKNAFALILFMFEAIKENCDLIILDDPISSFDDTKKFAILSKLFFGKKNFNNKTVLLLTHDFDVVIDIIYNFHRKICANAFYLHNDNGTITEKEIKKVNITSYKQIAMNNIARDESFVSSLIYLRRLFEFEGEDNMGYQLLANLFHKREIPVLKNESSYIPMTEDEIQNGNNDIRKLYASFDYADMILKIRNYSFLINQYNSTNVGYEKLQIYRILNVMNPTQTQYEDINIIDVSDNTFMKFVNETFHIENDYLFQLNPIEYEIIPNYILEKSQTLVNQIKDMLDNGEVS